VKIFLQPCEILAALFACSAVTTGRFATGRTDKLTTMSWRNFYFRCPIVGDASQDKRDRTQPPKNVSDHALDASGHCGGKPFQKLDGDWRIDPSAAKVLS
jgi:hypothetical protein